MFYETDGMALIRGIVTGDRHGLSQEDVDAFKRVLAALEKERFKLIRETEEE